MSDRPTLRQVLDDRGLTTMSSHMVDFLFECLSALKKIMPDQEVHSTKDLVDKFPLFMTVAYGPLSIPTLVNWGIKNYSDLGQVIADLVNARLLSWSHNDSPDDFIRNTTLYDDIDHCVQHEYFVHTLNSKGLLA